LREGRENIIGITSRNHEMAQQNQTRKLIEIHHGLSLDPPRDKIRDILYSSRKTSAQIERRGGATCQSPLSVEIHVKTTYFGDRVPSEPGHFFGFLDYGTVVAACEIATGSLAIFVPFARSIDRNGYRCLDQVAQSAAVPCGAESGEHEKEERCIYTNSSMGWRLV